MKVTDAEGTPSKTVSKIDLELPEGLPQTVQDQIKQDVGDYLVEQVLSTVAEARSPVTGEGWRKLSKDYAKLKEAEGLGDKPDMQESGDMLDSLTFKKTKDGLELGFFDSEAWKADGHLKFSGEPGTTPKRRFLPAEGQTFKSDIQRGVDEIIQAAVADSAPVDRTELKGVETASELYSVLKEAFPGMSKYEIRAAVMLSPDLRALLEDEDLLDLL